MSTTDDLFASFSRSYETRRETELSLADYLNQCRDNPMMYSSAAERLLAAIGEPEMVDTSKDARLGRIFMNRTIRVYPAFSEFFGMEETIERIVGFFGTRRRNSRSASRSSICSARSAAANPRSPSA